MRDSRVSSPSALRGNLALHGHSSTGRQASLAWLWLCDILLVTLTPSAMVEECVLWWDKEFNVQRLRPPY